MKILLFGIAKDIVGNQFLEDASFKAKTVAELKQELIQKYPDRIVNIHPSLLPSFRGSNAVKQALDSGVKITGCSAHIVHEKVDTGPILIQSAIPICNFDNEDSLLKKIQHQEHKILTIGVALAAKAWRDKILKGKK